jgi:hypothetical protein
MKVLKFNKFGVLLVINIITAVVLCIVIIHTHIERNRISPAIIGSFVVGSHLYPNPLKLVFDSRGTYTLYRPTELIEHGFFVPKNDVLYILYSEDSQNTRHAVRVGENELFLLSVGCDEVLKFVRFSDTPTYVNIHPPRHLW